MFCIPQYPDSLKWILSLLLPTHKLLNILRKLCVCVLHAQISSVTQCCPTLCNPMHCSTPGLPVLSPTPRVYSNSHPLSWWCCPTISSSCRPLLLPSIFPSIRIFSNESVLRIRWPKDWGFSFSISPSSEYSGLISFRMDWLDLLAVKGTQESSPTP